MLLPGLRRFNKLWDISQGNAFLYGRQLRLINPTSGRCRCGIVDDHDLGIIPRKRRSYDIEVARIDRRSLRSGVTLLGCFLKSRLLLRRSWVGTIAAGLRHVRMVSDLACRTLYDCRTFRYSGGCRELTIQMNRFQAVNIIAIRILPYFPRRRRACNE